jgi:tetratricopeptide (TPR) repeat protein
MKNILTIKLSLLSFLFLLLHSCGEEKEIINKEYNPKAVDLNNKAVENILHFKADSALILLDKAIELDETYYLPHSNKVKIYIDRGEIEKALYESEMVIKKKPDLAEGWTFAGMIHEKVGNNQKAKKYYQKSINIYDDRIKSPKKRDDINSNKVNRALSLKLLGRNSEANSEIKKLINEDPKNSMYKELLEISGSEYLNSIIQDK